MLDDLSPAPKVQAPKDFRPGVVFDGNEGEATTEGLQGQPNFDDFLRERGYPPEEYEIIGNPRTSQWQQREGGEWLTSYRFTFRKKNPEIDLKLAWQTAKSNIKKVKAWGQGEKVFVIVPSDYQIGKVASRGDTGDLLERVFIAYNKIEAHLKKNKYSRILLLDAGDMIEGVDNAASQAQLQSNDLSPMEQVDLGVSLMLELVKMAHKYAPVSYASVGSNHCQWRSQKQRVGKTGVDDWGIFILKQLRRLTSELDMDVTYYVPAEHDESLAIDVFEDGFHVLGLWHGHQSRRPEMVPTWWRQQAFGQQPVAAASIAVTGHFHHTRIQELGSHQNGGSRWWIQASTMDNGSDWFRQIAGEDSQTGITAFELQKDVHFAGSITRF